MNEREQIQVDKHVFIDKLKTTKRNFKDNNAADGVFSLLLWFAVLDDVLLFKGGGAFIFLRLL